MQASGDASIRRRIGRFLVALNSGCAPTLSRIGANARLTSTDGTMNRM